MVVRLVIGLVVLAVAAHLAFNIREVGDAIESYYRALASFNRPGGRWMNWGLRPNHVQSLILAWVLVALGAALGITFIVTAVV